MNDIDMLHSTRDMGFTAQISHLTPHTSRLTPHASHLTPHTSHLTPATTTSLACEDNTEKL
jgi:hypothetical protein